jgi:hypothetical protein
MPELGSYGSVRGAAGNSRPYRERSHGVARHRTRWQASEKRSCRKSRCVRQDVAAGLWRFRDCDVGDGAFARAAGMAAGGFARPIAPAHGLSDGGWSRQEGYPARCQAFCGKRLRGRR